MKFLIIFLSIALLSSAGAATFGLYTYEMSYADGGRVTITDYPNDATGAIAIPANIDGYPVTSIGGDAFQNCTGLTSITIPESVTYIGRGAFRNCSGLTSITIPNSVVNISDYTFQNCTSLTSVTIHETVSWIRWGAFANCTSLTSFVVAATNPYYSSIGPLLIETIFDGSTELISASGASGDLTIPDGVTSIRSNAFWGCTGLTSITIPDSVTIIGERAFKDCTGLTSATIGNSVTSIGRYAFKDCTGLTSINIPYSVTSIGDEAFWNCTSLTSINIPPFVNSIGDKAFYRCTSLSNFVVSPVNIYYKSVGPLLLNWSGTVLIAGAGASGGLRIPDRVNSIESFAFSGSSLTGVIIPDSVTSVELSAFSNCTNLVSIRFESMLGSRGLWDAFGFLPTNAVIYYPIGATAYSTSYGGAPTEPMLYTYAINPYNLSVTITDYPTDATGAIAIPANIDGYPVTSIGGGAFQNCTGLTSITIPDSVTSIGWGAFSNCSGLTSITIPDSVTGIGTSAFYSCTSLTSFVVAADNPNYSSIGPLLLNKIGTVLIAAPGASGDLTIPDGVTSIGTNAFQNCTGLTSITIPDSVTSIGTSAFYSCTSLTSFVVAADNPNYSSIGPLLLNKIGTVLIAGAGASGDLTIPDSVTSIGSNAFRGSSLTSVTIGNSVTSIGLEAFRSCTNLVSIRLELMTAPTIGSNAFTLTSSGAIIYYPYGATGYAASYDGVPTTAEAPTYGLYTYVINSDNVSVTIINYPTDATGAIAIPATINGRSVTSIGLSAFQNCISLTSITIPNNVASIGTLAFQNCTGLTSITIPDSVTSIGLGAFSNCSGLTSITIPDSVTSIGTSAFYSCTSLTSFVVAADNPNYSSIGPLLLNKIGTVLIAGAGASGDLTIPDSVTSIGSNAFRGSSLTSVTIGNSVTSIGLEAFRSCTNLVSIRLELMTAPTIGSDAFTLTSSGAIIYYPYGATGYAASYDGVPTTHNGFTADDLNTATTQGRQDVVADPVSYSLYTSTEVASSRTAGRQDVVADPASYSLYTSTEVVSSRTAGRQDVVADPASYSLYTSTEVASSRTAGRQDVVADPASYSLYTSTEVASSRTAGRQDVVADPASYGLHTSATAQAQLIDLRTGSKMLSINGSNVVMQLQIQRSDDLSTWTSTADDIITVELPMQAGKGFYRFAMPQE